MNDARLTRLEEAQAFTERTVETLDAEVRELNERVAALRRAMSTLEARLEALSRRSPHDPDDAPGAANEE